MNTSIKIHPATNSQHFQTIEQLAWEILPEHYAPFVPDVHTKFLVEKFQTVKALQQQIQNNFEYYLLSYSENIVGYVGIQIKKNSILLSKLYILKSHRKKGIGDVAMEFVIQRARKEKIKEIELIVNRKNYNTIEFYKKRGYIITEEQINTFENGHTVEDYKMIKTI